MLEDNNTPKFLWAEAAKTAVYLLNRSPASFINKTPYEAWHGHKPNISHSKVFGCAISAATPNIPSRKKLDTRGTPSLLVGYEGSHQYRAYDPIARRVLRVRDAKFDEGVARKQLDEPIAPAAMSEFIGATPIHEIETP